MTNASTPIRPPRRLVRAARGYARFRRDRGPSSGPAEPRPLSSGRFESMAIFNRPLVVGGCSTLECVFETRPPAVLGPLRSRPRPTAPEGPSCFGTQPGKGRLRFGTESVHLSEAGRRFCAARPSCEPNHPDTSRNMSDARHAAAGRSPGHIAGPLSAVAGFVLRRSRAGRVCPRRSVVCVAQW